MSCLAYVQTHHSLCYSTFEMKTHLVKYVLYISLLITMFFRCTGLSQFQQHLELVVNLLM